MGKVVDMRTWKSKEERLRIAQQRDIDGQRHDAKITWKLLKEYEEYEKQEQQKPLTPERKRLQEFYKRHENTYTPLVDDEDYSFEGQPGRLARTCGCGCQEFIILIDGNIECPVCSLLAHNTDVFQDGLPCEDGELTKIEEAYQKLEK